MNRFYLLAELKSRGISVEEIAREAEATRSSVYQTIQNSFDGRRPCQRGASRRIRHVIARKLNAPLEEIFPAIQEQLAS